MSNLMGALVSRIESCSFRNNLDSHVIDDFRFDMIVSITIG